MLIGRERETAHLAGLLDAARRRRDRRGRLLAAVLMLTPAWFAIEALRSGDPLLAGVLLAAVAGAGAATFALRAGSLLTALRSAGPAAGIRVGAMVLVLGGIHAVNGVPVDVPAALGTALKFFAIYFPALFVIEEVAFRGALDAHVHHAGEERAWRSALLVFVLWGLWHLPVNDGSSLPLLAAELVAVHGLIGVPLSFAWRRSNNLAGPALAHALIDAVRNALLLGL